MRVTAAVATLVLAFLGLLNWQSFALIVACVALVLSMVAIFRSGRRDGEWTAWQSAQIDSQLARAREQGAALRDDLRED